MYINPNYKIRSSEHEEALKKAGELLKEALPEGMQFTLFLFSDNPQGTFYVSTVERDSGVGAILEWVGDVLSDAEDKIKKQKKK